MSLSRPEASNGTPADVDALERAAAEARRALNAKLESERIEAKQKTESDRLVREYVEALLSRSIMLGTSTPEIWRAYIKRWGKENTTQTILNIFWGLLEHPLSGLTKKDSGFSWRGEDYATVQELTKALLTEMGFHNFDTIDFSPAVAVIIMGMSTEALNHEGSPLFSKVNSPVKNRVIMMAEKALEPIVLDESEVHLSDISWLVSVKLREF